MPVSEEAWKVLPLYEGQGQPDALSRFQDERVLTYLRKRKEEVDREKKELAEQRMPFNVAEGIERIPPNLIGGAYGVPSDVTLGMEEYIPTVPAVRSDIKYDPEGGAAGTLEDRSENTIEKQAAAIIAAEESGPTPFEDRLNSTLANYGSLADSLPIPSGNPLILKQREELQGKADLWARLRNQRTSPIVFKDRMTAAQTKAAYEQQKDQFLGDVFAMAMPSNIEETNALARAIGADQSSWIDLHNILRQTRRDFAYENQELTFKKAKDQDNVGMVLPSILQELQRDNGGRTPTRTQILNRLVEYSDTYNWPRLVRSALHFLKILMFQKI